MNVPPSLLRTQALELTLALARHTDNNTAAATAGAVMFLRGMGHERPDQTPQIEMAYRLIVDAVGEEHLDEVLNAASRHLSHQLGR